MTHAAVLLQAAMSYNKLFLSVEAEIDVWQVISTRGHVRI